MTTLVLFAWFKWSGNVKGGTVAVLKRGILGSWWHAPVYQGPESAYRQSAFGSGGNIKSITHEAHLWSSCPCSRQISPLYCSRRT